MTAKQWSNDIWFPLAERSEVIPTIEQMLTSIGVDEADVNFVYSIEIPADCSVRRVAVGHRWDQRVDVQAPRGSTEAEQFVFAIARSAATFAVWIIVPGVEGLSEPILIPSARVANVEVTIDAITRGQKRPSLLRAVDAPTKTRHRMACDIDSWSRSPIPASKLVSLVAVNAHALGCQH